MSIPVENNIHEQLEKFVGGAVKPFQPHMTIDLKNKRIVVFFEDCSYLAEWINPEVDIYRAVDDNRFVGIAFPVAKWNDKFPIYLLDPEYPNLHMVTDIKSLPVTGIAQDEVDNIRKAARDSANDFLTLLSSDNKSVNMEG